MKGFIKKVSRWRSLRGLDLQGKIVVVLTLVVVPIFVVVTIAENQLTVPFLIEEMRQFGSVASKNLATQLETRRLLPAARDERLNNRIDRMIQDQVFFQPQILRMEVWSTNPETDRLELMGSNLETDLASATLNVDIPDRRISELKEDEANDVQYWEILEPLFPRGVVSKHGAKPYGVIRTQVSLKSVEAISEAFWKVTIAAAIASVLILIVVLTYFLRRTIQNDRLLRQTQDVNIQLAEQLHEAQRAVMNTEKLAVMGQLTASFAHEIGTPLNAMSGHLQLLLNEVTNATNVPPKAADRIEIISGQLEKIENIVKSFMQSTAKPTSQRQLVDPNQVIDRAIGIVRPRAQASGIEVRAELDRTLGPLRVAPVELEQVLLNLFNNAIDSLRAKSRESPGATLTLFVETSHKTLKSEPVAVITIRDTGMGIGKKELSRIFTPFYTTKPQGEGTGLGLTICRDILSRYQGKIEVDSKEGSWTKVKIQLPYRLEA